MWEMPDWDDPIWLGGEDAGRGPAAPDADKQGETFAKIGRKAQERRPKVTRKPRTTRAGKAKPKIDAENERRAQRARRAKGGPKANDAMETTEVGAANESTEEDSVPDADRANDAMETTEVGAANESTKKDSVSDADRAMVTEGGAEQAADKVEWDTRVDEARHLLSAAGPKLRLMQKLILTEWLQRHPTDDCAANAARPMHVVDGCPCEIWACTRDVGVAPTVWMHVFVDFKVFFVWLDERRQLMATESLPAPMAAVCCVERIPVPTTGGPQRLVRRMIECAAACNTVLMLKVRKSTRAFKQPLGHGCAIRVERNAGTANRRRELCALIVDRYTEIRKRDALSAAKLIDSAVESIGVKTTKSVLQAARGDDAVVKSICQRFVTRHRAPSTCEVANPEALTGNTNLYRLLAVSNQTSHSHSTTASMLGIASHCVFDAAMARPNGYRAVIMAMPLSAIVVGMAARDAVAELYPGFTDASVGKLTLWPGKNKVAGGDLFCAYRPDLTFMHGGKQHCLEFKTVWRMGGALPASTDVRHKMQAYLQGYATSAATALLVRVTVPFRADIEQVDVEILQYAFESSDRSAKEVHGTLGVKLSSWGKPPPPQRRRADLEIDKGVVKTHCLALARRADKGPNWWSFTYDRRVAGTRVAEHATYPRSNPRGSNDPAKLEGGAYRSFETGMLALASTAIDA
jgi:hypothetical protein